MATTTTPAFRDALQRVRPRWRTLLYMLSGVVMSFLVPGIALCRVVPLSQIVWAIAATTFLLGASLSVGGRLLERRAVGDRRVDDLLLSGVLTMAAGLLWAEIAMQPGPVAARSLEFWPSLAICLLIGVVGGALLRQRARRLVSQL